MLPPLDVKVMGGAKYSLTFILSCKYGLCVIFAKIGGRGGGNAPYSLNVTLSCEYGSCAIFAKNKVEGVMRHIR